MELGMHAPKCSCIQVCKNGVEPMADCVCCLPGETITATCTICDPTGQKFTWHNNGSCISCVRNAREAKKAAKLARFQHPTEVSLEDAIVLPGEEEMEQFKRLPSREQRRIFPMRDSSEAQGAGCVNGSISVRGSSEAEQAAVNGQVAGSTPAPAAISVFLSIQGTIIELSLDDKEIIKLLQKALVKCYDSNS